MALTFPTDLSDRYFFDLRFVTYSRPNPFSGQINLLQPASDASPGSGNIRLPVPSNMVETQKLVWQQEENLDGIAGVTVSTLTGDVAGIQAGLSKMSGDLFKAASSAVENVIGSRIAGSPSEYTFQKSGLALNPVLTQTFKNPEFKVHAFSWTLAPETKYESYAIQQIVDTIKQQSLPDIALGGAFFKYPSIAMVQIHTGNNGELYKFQPAVITSVTVNYAPTGIPSFMAGTNAPTLVKLDITLLEIILNTRSNSGLGNVLGYDFSLGGIGNDALKQKGLELARARL